MAFKYDKLWKLLEIRDMTKDDLRREIGASQTTIVSMGKNKNVSLDVVDRICTVLRCTPDEVMEYVSDPNLSVNYPAPKNGEIYFVSLLEDDVKMRPAVIHQNNYTIPYHQMVMIIPLTSSILVREQLPTMVKIEKTDSNGLKVDCYAMIHQMRAVGKYQLIEKIGNMGMSKMFDIRSAISSYFGWFIEGPDYDLLNDDEKKHFEELKKAKAKGSK